MEPKCSTNNLKKLITKVAAKYSDNDNRFNIYSSQTEFSLMSCFLTSLMVLSFSFKVSLIPSNSAESSTCIEIN